MSSQIPINAIYFAHEGEGVFVGTPQIFVRLQGCLVGCANCDSKDTWSFADEKTPLMTINDIAEDVEKKAPSLKRLSLTGGDPLHPKLVPSSLAIVTYFKGQNFWINIEAAGTRIEKELFTLVDFISFDIKTPSTKVRHQSGILRDFLTNYGHKGQIKAVCNDEEDFFFVLNLWREFSFLAPQIPWVLTPAFDTGAILDSEKILELYKLNARYGSPFRIILQQHKVLHGSLASNV
jgi:7-carboxy-7-deazaguanine synthase